MAKAFDPVDRLCADAIRTRFVDAVQRANLYRSGASTPRALVVEKPGMTAEQVVTQAQQPINDARSTGRWGFQMGPHGPRRGHDDES